MRVSVMLTGDHTPQSNCLCRKCVLTGWNTPYLQHDPVEEGEIDGRGCDGSVYCVCDTVLLGGVEFYKPSPDNGIQLTGAVIITRIHVDADGCEIPDDEAGWE